jgi:hypothetical protein
MTRQEDTAVIAGQLAELTRAIEQMSGQLITIRERADTQQERIDLAARELAEVSARLQAAANALRESVWSAVDKDESVVVWETFEQASHNGDLVHAVAAGSIAREQVTELGAVLMGSAPGREAADEITVFDSTGLAIQDLAIGIEVVKRYGEDANEGRFSGVQHIEIG